MDNNKLNEAVGSLSQRIKELKANGASSEEIQAAVFEMIDSLGINIPLDKISEKMKGLDKSNG
ncbi:hypothetical protein [Bacillus weihaiensis]|uniref:Uncharacterized protein n=1 Tax=Bacillus weihaiensis TaxID=1547283 RepID=A0A1L3MQZ8_9BACI|nr:hypothetical protein [Bacillus weihaiensis]APH04767.1 hypothetical protein A9C19_08415 [Bacillus weihaiensis]